MEIEGHEYHVSLEVAKMLKDAGFDWKCEALYDRIGNFIHILYDAVEWDFGKINWNVLHRKQARQMGIAGWEGGYSAPTLDVAQRWLREVKHVEVLIEVKYLPNTVYYARVEYEKYGYVLGTHSTYEEAQEAGIKKALEIILEKGE